MSSKKWPRSGALSTRRSAEGGSARIPLFLAHKNLKPFIDKHLTPEHFATARRDSSRDGFELKPSYYAVAVDNLRAAEKLKHQSTLFDVAEATA